MHATSNYFRQLSDGFSAGWNRFWFTPTDVAGVCVLRILSGLAAFYFLLSHTADLNRWFGAAGLLPSRIVFQPEFAGKTVFGGAPLREASFHISYLSGIDDPSLLWIAHAMGLVIVGLFTLGLFSRITNVLSVIVVLSYVHRAPMLTGQLEPLLTMMLIYLCFAPTGAWMSLDAWLKKRRGGNLDGSDLQSGPSRGSQSWTATVSRRLIQVHLAGLVLMMALTKLAGTTWWSGDAVWWLIAHSESRLVDLTFLSGAPILFSAWTHGIVLFELAFPILIWNRLARPLLLVLAVVVWIPLALVTGLVAFFVTLLFASVAFIPSATLRGLLTQQGEDAPSKQAEPQRVKTSKTSTSKTSTSKASRRKAPASKAVPSKSVPSKELQGSAPAETCRT